MEKERNVKKVQVDGRWDDALEMCIPSACSSLIVRPAEPFDLNLGSSVLNRHAFA